MPTLLVDSAERHLVSAVRHVKRYQSRRQQQVLLVDHDESDDAGGGTRKEIAGCTPEELPVPCAKGRETVRDADGGCHQRGVHEEIRQRRCSERYKGRASGVAAESVPGESSR